jgi:hypothetical protein
MTTEAQREQAEHLATLRNDQSVREAQKPVSAAELSARVEELSRKGLRAQPSTYLDHVEQPAGGRHAQPQTVAAEPWPKTFGYWAEADMGTERPFGQQLTEFGISQTTVQEKKR